MKTQTGASRIGLGLLSLATANLLLAADVAPPGPGTGTNERSAPVVSAAAGEQAAPTNGFTSAWFLEVVRLISARISPDVVLAFIANTPGTFNLSPEHIIYLANLGTTPEVINAMLEHDYQIQSGLLPVVSSVVPIPPEPINPPMATTAAANVNAPAPAAPSVAATIISKLATILNQQATPQTVLPSASPAGSIVVPDDAPEPDWAALLQSTGEAPEQPDSLYRVRLPHAVKLTDPIFVWHYPGDY
jgi:hypothetical protein